MAISGYLSEFSLPEIFQLLEQGNKTGCLSIREHSRHSPHKGRAFYIWFKQGYIIGTADRLDGQGLLSIIQQRGWLSARASARITEVCAINQPTGLCLKSQGLLEAEQLKLLFSQQVLQQVSKLFELQEGQFQFESTTTLPWAEMTGLSATPKEVTLAGLRVLQDWTMLQDKLPEPTSGLVSGESSRPKLRLNQLEWQVWEFANGKAPIREIAMQLQWPLEKIQQVAFRLMVMGFVEEVPLLSEALPQLTEADEMSLLSDSVTRRDSVTSMMPAQAAVSQSFLKNLVGFLKGKA